MLEALGEGAEEIADGVGEAGGEGSDGEGLENAHEGVLADDASLEGTDDDEGNGGEDAGGEKGIPDHSGLREVEEVGEEGDDADGEEGDKGGAGGFPGGGAFGGDAVFF